MCKKKKYGIGILFLLVMFLMTITVHAETIDIPWPTDINHTYKGGFALYDGHNGMDINASSGTVLYAPFDGVATFYQRYRPVNGTNVYVSYGNYVEITSTDERCPGYKVIICHMSSFNGANFKVSAVNAADYYSDHSGAMKVASWNSATDKIANCGTKNVYMGDVVGYSGSTGRSTGPHLHVTLYRGNTLLDPYGYFDDSISAYDYARSVFIDSDIPKLYIGQSNTFLWHVRDGVDKSKVRWEAEPGGIVEIDNNANVKAKAAGVVTIRPYVLRDDGKKLMSSDSAVITVKKPTIKLNYTTATVYGNESLQLKATVEGPTQNVTWKVNSSLYSTVTKNGLVKVGSMDTTRTTTTIVTATANGVSATCKIIRKPALLKFNQSSWTLNTGASKTITVTARGASKVNYASSNRSVATVNSSTGKVTIKKEGTVKITATGGGGSASYTIKAKPTVKLDISSGTIGIGYSKKLTATVKGTTATKRWSSSNPNVVSVSSSGKITSKRVGTATITVSVKGIHGTVSDKCTVKVVKPVIKLSKTSANMYVSSSGSLTATVKYSKKNVTWKTSNSNVVSISASGNRVIVKAKKAGTATITAYIGNVKATCKIAVKPVNWKRLYYNFLKKAENSFTYKSGNYTNTASAKSFYLLHLNSDKIPELVVSPLGNGGSTWNIYYVFTIKNNRVVYCGMTSERDSRDVRYNKKHRAIDVGWWTNGIGGSGEELYVVRNEKLIVVKYAYSYNEGSKRVYKAGNNSSTAKIVSESYSEAFGKKFFNSKDMVYGTRLLNTESVRLQQFK